MYRRRLRQRFAGSFSVGKAFGGDNAVDRPSGYNTAPVWEASTDCAWTYAVCVCGEVHGPKHCIQRGEYRIKGTGEETNGNMKKNSIIRGVLAAAILGVALAAPLLAGDGVSAAEGGGFYGTAWALLPPVIAIGLALITKEVYSSL